jgi:large subunit ribosomal protein L28
MVKKPLRIFLYRRSTMSKICDICGKKPTIGYNVSHAHNKTKTRWYPNLQKVKTVRNGRNVKLRVCTSCIRSGLVTKA